MTYKLFEEWRRWLDEVSILKNKNPFKALYILGPAGAGKSFVSKNIGVPKDFKVSNPDERIEEVFPLFGISLKFADSDLDPEQVDLEMLQQNSRTILQNANIGHTSNLIAIASPLLFDTTGEDVEKVSAKMKTLVELGYDIGVIVINVPPSVSVDRDQQRKRTVGVARTTRISNAFQDRVVIGQAYPKIAKTNPNVVVLGDVYPNVFDLSSGQLLPGIDPQVMKSLPQFQNATPESAKQILGKIKEDLSSWLGAGPINTRGKIILAAMQRLVKISGGRLGQNMNDIPIALANPELRQDDVLRKAAAILGGDIKNKIQGATGTKKPTIEPTIRGSVNTFKKED